MIIEIEEDSDLPPLRSTPFFICGLIAVFVYEADPFPVGVGLFGVKGEAESAKLREDIAGDLRLHVPSFKTLSYLHQMVPSAEHISSYPLQLLFELYPIAESNSSRFSLPKRLGGPIACYHNDTLLKQHNARLMEPDPRHVDEHGEHKFDDTDYLDPTNGGTLGPGCMLAVWLMVWLSQTDHQIVVSFSNGTTS
jgi:hypothetical protein